MRNGLVPIGVVLHRALKLGKVLLDHAANEVQIKISSFSFEVSKAIEKHYARDEVLDREQDQQSRRDGSQDLGT